MNQVTALGRTDLVIGVSVSEPSEADLISRGLSLLHIRHAFIEVCRHVLAKGWSVAYGGDLRAAGYTETMFDLARTYDREDMAGPDRVLSYLAWPLWVGLPAKTLADLMNVTTMVKVEPPSGAPEELAAIAARSPEERLWFSRSLTRMRSRMTAAIDGRVVVGGRTSGQQGLFPGVAEEALLAFEHEVPLYVAGGFGGCGAALAAVVRGSVPEELSTEYQARHTSGYSELVEAAGQAGEEPTPAARFDVMAAAGLDGLRNGLDHDENARLLATDDVDELVALVLRGLRRLEGRS